jgi:cellulose synthase/poly-beta-1,6-N-acetylglucosamine synthase-like glycosyltransferase
VGTAFLLGVLFIATFVQLALWLRVYARLALYHPNSSHLKEPLPALSVIICARNEAENLQRRLPAVLAQDYPDYEVIVVDDDSADDTPALLRRLAAEYSRLRALRLSPKTSPGKKAALAYGITAAQNEWLVFTDADCTPASSYWLREMALRMEMPSESPVEIVLGYGPYIATAGALNGWVRFETVFTAMQYGAFALCGLPYMGVGRNLAWKKSLFARTSGFASHAGLASGDDDLFVNAVATAHNTVLCFSPQAFTYSSAPNSWAGWFRQKRRHLSTGHRYRRRHRVALAAVAGSQVAHYGLLAWALLCGFTWPALACWSVRLAAAYWVFSRVAQRLDAEDLSRCFPLFDALLALYWGGFVPLAWCLSVWRKTPWK